MKQVLLLVSLLVAGILAGRGAVFVYDRIVNPPIVPVTEGDFSVEVQARPMLFMTSTCPFCKQAVEYLDRNGIAYDKLVIDKSAMAKQRYDRLDLRGVPVLMTRSVKIVGYHPEVYGKYLAPAP